MSKESSLSSPTPFPGPKPRPDLEVSELLPEGCDLEEVGLIPTSAKRFPAVNDNPTRRHRQFLREAVQMKEMVAKGLQDPITQSRLAEVIPTLSAIATNSPSARARAQASRELREWVKLFEGQQEKGSQGQGGFNIQAGNVQINVNGTGEGAIVSLSEAPE